MTKIPSQSSMFKLADIFKYKILFDNPFNITETNPDRTDYPEIIPYNHIKP